MASTVGIINRALSYLGAGQITAITDDTVEANIMNAVYDGVLDSLLEAREWSFNTFRAQLALNAAAPDHGYANSFAIPSDTLRILSCRDNTNEESSVSNNLDWAREGQNILCNATTVYCRYLKRITDPNLFSPGFQQALVTRLAAETSVTFTESSTVRREMWQMYAAAINEAATLDSMQGRSRSTRSPWVNQARSSGPGDGGSSFGPTV